MELAQQQESIAMTKTPAMERKPLRTEITLCYAHETFNFTGEKAMAIDLAIQNAVRSHPTDARAMEVVEKAKALKKYLFTSLNAGPLTKDPSREAKILRELYEAIDDFDGVTTARQFTGKK